MLYKRKKGEKKKLLKQLSQGFIEFPGFIIASILLKQKWLFVCSPIGSKSERMRDPK